MPSKNNVPFIYGLWVSLIIGLSGAWAFGSLKTPEVLVKFDAFFIAGQAKGTLVELSDPSLLDRIMASLTPIYMSIGLTAVMFIAYASIKGSGRRRFRPRTTRRSVFLGITVVLLMALQYFADVLAEWYFTSVYTPHLEIVSRHDTTIFTPYSVITSLAVALLVYIDYVNDKGNMSEDELEKVV